MTQLQFVETKERVEKYEKLENEIKRLEIEKRLISIGILNITSNYQRDIDCTNRYDGFRERLEKKIAEFYENEIKMIHKNMEDI